MKPFFLKEITRTRCPSDGFVNVRMLRKWAHKQAGRPFDSVMSDLRQVDTAYPGRFDRLCRAIGIEFNAYKDGHRYCSSADRELNNDIFYRNEDGIFSIYKKVPLEEADGSRWIEFSRGDDLTVHWKEGDKSIYVYRWVSLMPSNRMGFLNVKLPLHMSSGFVQRFHFRLGATEESYYWLSIPESCTEIAAPKDPKDLGDLTDRFQRNGGMRLSLVATLSDYNRYNYFKIGRRFKQATKETFNNSYFGILRKIDKERE